MMKAVCLRCSGSGETGCPMCLGFGWHWDDGVPPTICPVSKNGAILPCHRPECSSCGRQGDAIGTESDRSLTSTVMAAMRKKSEERARQRDSRHRG